MLQSFSIMLFSCACLVKVVHDDVSDDNKDGNDENSNGERHDDGSSGYDQQQLVIFQCGAYTLESSALIFISCSS